MSEYTIKQIGNGWLLTDQLEDTIFVPNLHILNDVLITWQTKGYKKALAKYHKKMEEE